MTKYQLVSSQKLYEQHFAQYENIQHSSTGWLFILERYKLFFPFLFLASTFVVVLSAASTGFLVIMCEAFLASP